METPPASPTPEVAGRSPLVGFYVLLFGAVGVTLPFLPAYFKGLGLSATQVGILLAINPLMMLWAPALWGHLADRTGRPDRVLSVITFGTFLCFAPLVGIRDFSWLLVAYCGYAFFASAITTLVDSLTLGRIASVGGSYAHIRLWGSAGFVASSMVFGALVDEVNVSAIWVPLAFMGAYFLWSLRIRARTRPGAIANPLAGVRLLRNRDLALFLTATCLHWLACAPFHGTFAIHVTALGLQPWVVGVSAGLGVLAEIGVMAVYPRTVDLITPRRLLAFAFFASALRWAGMAVATSAPAIIALSALHGLTFGAFYVAAVGFVAARVPSHLRASGQALLVAATFGVGGLLGYLLSGIGYDWVGGHRLFAIGAGLELVAMAVVLGVKPRPANNSEVQVV